MKYLFVLALGFLGPSLAIADSACQALSSVVGTYSLLAKDCSGPFGNDFKDLVVEPREGGGYLLISGGIFIGPSNDTNSADRCTVENESIVVKTCVNHNTCLPRNWVYTFTKDQATLQAAGCLFQFKKVN